jgi:hypothetical protein
MLDRCLMIFITLETIQYSAAQRNRIPGQMDTETFDYERNGAPVNVSLALTFDVVKHFQRPLLYPSIDSLT